MKCVICLTSPVDDEVCDRCKVGIEARKRDTYDRIKNTVRHASEQPSQRGSTSLRVTSGRPRKGYRHLSD